MPDGRRPWGVSCRASCPQHDAGTAITVTRGFADYVVTEYGVASLLGKTFRQRAEELISIAHPDFRAELRQEAQKLFYP